MRILKKCIRTIKQFLTIKEVRSINIPVYQGKLLEGKTALIIGGTGGIGNAIAIAFANNGCKVVISGTNREKIKKICRSNSNDIQGVYMDLNNISSIEGVISEAVEMLDGHIDILVNSAGVHGPSDFWSISEEDYDSVMDINVKAMYFCCQIVGRHMRDKAIAGHILNISSASALKLGKTPYEISKNAVRSMTLGIAHELIPYGIIVNCLGPGPTATSMLDKDKDSSIEWSGNPTGRLATPEEIANWAVFLVSNLGDYIVGDSLYVSGGSGTICIDK